MSSLSSKAAAENSTGFTSQKGPIVSSSSPPLSDDHGDTSSDTQAVSTGSKDQHSKNSPSVRNRRGGENKRKSFLRRYEVPATSPPNHKRSGSFRLQDFIPFLGGNDNKNHQQHDGSAANPDEDRSTTMKTKLTTEKTPLLNRASDIFLAPQRLFRKDPSKDRPGEEDEEQGTMVTTAATVAGTGGVKKGWKTVMKHVDKGDFLLESMLQNNSSGSSNNFGLRAQAAGNSRNLSIDDTFYGCTTKSSNSGNCSGSTSGHGSSGSGVPDHHNVLSTQQLRKEAMEQYQQDMTFSPKACLLAIGMYLVVSVFMFCFVLEPEWTVIDSCYFAVTTFTTTGYGDLVPTSLVSQIFTAVYAILGVAFLGLALGVLGSKMLEIQGNKEWGSNISREYDAMTLFDSSGDDNDSVINLGSNAASNNSTESTGPEEEIDKIGKHRHLTRQQQKEAMNDFQRTVESTESVFSLRRFLILLGVAISMAFAIGTSSGWNVFQTLYYYIITGSTIGYGELAPRTQLQRLLAVFFIPLSVCVTGYVLAYVADAIIDNLHRKAFDARVALHKELTVDDLRILDVDGDGTVTYNEFLEFMLLAMKKVDPGLLDALREYFDKLDVDKTGLLSKNDLIETARRKLKSPRRKLELAEYKQRLLQVANDARHQK